MKYFNNIHTLDELKKAYRRLVMENHPDRGGDTKTMQEINNEHDELFERLKTAHNTTADEYHKTTETPEEFRKIINTLIKIPGITCELCGRWVWVSGNTRPFKEELKSAGLRWSKNKCMWYWHHAEDGSRYHKGTKTIAEIRSKYGSQTFSAEYLNA